MLVYLIAIVFLVIVVGVVYLFIWWDEKQLLKIKQRRLAEYEEKKRVYDNARSTYLKCLSELKGNPTNPNLKQRTLYYGREFANLARLLFQGDDTITVFDEIALMNDINAACAGSVLASDKNSTNNLTVEERLMKLSELKEKNLVSETEYNERRRKSLDEI